jgi:two-component system cell cycle response regulator
MKKEILIYVEDKEVLKFLKTFFKGRDYYSVRFLIKKDKNALHKELCNKKPAALIVGSSNMFRHINPSEFDFPAIALITHGSVVQALRSAVRSGVKYHLLAPFCEEDLEDRLRIAIGGKSWLKDRFNKKKEHEVLMEMAHLFSSTLNPKEILSLTVKGVSEIINVHRCSIIRLDSEDHSCAHVVSTSEDPEISDIRLDLKKYPEIKRALSLKCSVVIKDTLKDPIMKGVRDIMSLVGIRSILVVPVVLYDDVIGTLLLRMVKRERSFSKREVSLCTSIANTSANALYNAFIYDKTERERRNLERLAITDYLTGVYNVRYFYNRLDEEFSRAERHKMPLSCMMFDIDNFKRVNDTYGHRVGDVVLREFAQLVRGHTRKSDIFARYGGEEFIMLLPQTSLAGAISEAERLSKVVREYQFYTLKEGEGITVSIGISCSPDEKIKTPDDLITFADDALFTSKRKGRDQIALSSL